MAGFLIFAHAERALSQSSSPEKPAAAQDSTPAPSQALLQKVKQSAMAQRIAIKQTEIDRLNEDLAKSRKDLDATHNNLDATTALIATSNANMDKLAAARRSLEQQLELTDLRIEAERKECEGLRRLSGAQNSELDAINQRMAEIDVRSGVRQAEVGLLSAGKPVPGEDNDERGSAELYKLRKELNSDEQKTVSAELIARNAMKAASARLELAQEAASRVKQASEAVTQGNLAPVGEKPAGEADSMASPTPRPHKKRVPREPSEAASPKPASPSPSPSGGKQKGA